jgi:hypothetical protein
MSSCPEIDALLRAGAEGDRAFGDHVAGCPGCAAVLALEAFRRLPDRPGERTGCAGAMPEIAALAASVLDDGGRRRLAAHLTGCARCRETTVRMAFFAGDLDDVADPVFALADMEREVTRVRERLEGGRRARARRQKATWAAAVGVVAVAAAAMFALRSAARPGPESAEDVPTATHDGVAAATAAPVLAEELAPSGIGMDAGSLQVPAVDSARPAARPAPTSAPRRPQKREGSGVRRPKGSY